MKGAKFIHGLLIAILVYGQVVTAVHAASHLHTHSDVSHHSFLHTECGFDVNELTHTLPSLAHQHSHSPADEHSSAEKDCSIYHVLLSLNGLFWASENQLGLRYQPDLNQSLLSSFITVTTADKQPIRAPPVTS